MLCDCSFVKFFVRANKPACTRSPLKVPPNSVLSGRYVWLVRAGRPKPRLVRPIFFSSPPNPGAFVIFTHRFWRGVGHHISFGAPMAFWRNNSNFAEMLLFVDSFRPDVERETHQGIDFTFAPKSALSPPVFTQASLNTFCITHVVVNRRQDPGQRIRR